MARKRAPSLEDAIAQLRRRHGGRLAPPLEGLAYRFTIWLPVLAQGKEVFTGGQRIVLYSLFHDCFGGFSQSSLEGFPPWSGSWLPPGTDEPTIDHHIVLVIYATQDAEALTCMRKLKWILQQKHIANQRVVLVEQVPVHLVEAEPLN